MGQSIFYVETGTNNAWEQKFEDSWVNRFGWARFARKMQKFQNSKLMVQWNCLAEVSNKKASKPIFQNSWVNRFFTSRMARIMHGEPKSEDSWVNRFG